MPRILMVTNLFYPLMGGSEHVVFETSRRLVKEGHEVHVLTELTKPDWPVYEQVEGIHIHRCQVSFSNPITRFGSGVFNAARLFRQLSTEYAFDLLHFHLTLSSIGVLFCRASRRSARIASFYGPWDEEELVERRIRSRWSPGRLKALLFRMLQKFVLQRSSKIIVLSDYSRGQVTDLIGAAERCVLIPGGVDLDRFRPARDRSQVRSRFQIPPDQTTLLTIRRLVPRMGIDTLIAAMPLILSQNQNVSLIIGSDGPLRSDLERQVDQLGIREHVRFTGFIPQEELPQYYQAADLFIMPTRALEGFGLPVVEAMACGTPALGTAVGSITELIGAFDKRLLIPEATPETIATAVHTLIRSTLCEEGFRALCRRHVENHYGWDQITESLEKTYQLVLQISGSEFVVDQNRSTEV